MNHCNSGQGRRRASSRRLSTAALLAGLAMLGGVTPAVAADPNVSVSVTAIPETASFSRAADSQTQTEALTTYSAFRGRIVNNSTNALNDVRFHGEAAFVNGLPPTKVSSIGLTCTFGTATGVTTVDCPIGQLRGRGGASPIFVLIFETPKAPSSTVSCTDLNGPVPANCDRIDFNWTAFYSEGSNDSGGASHVDNTPGVTRTALGTNTPDTVNTFVPDSTGNILFYTGASQHATAGNPWVTLFKVPLTAQAIVAENDTFQSCTGVLSCWVSQMSVNDLADVKAVFANCSSTNLGACLKVILRRDESTLASGAKIANAIIRYSPDGDFVNNAIDLPACGTVDSVTQKTYPFLDHPCIGKRTAYPKKPANLLDSNDWEFEIYGFDNGSFRG